MRAPTPRRWAFSIATVVFVFALSACNESNDPNATADIASTEVRRADEPTCAGLGGFDKVLCAEPDVRQLDADLSKMLNRLVARSRHERQADIRARQADWLADRDACINLARPKRRACIDAVYLDRMQDIQQQIRAASE